jgi:membrane-associated protease RseP (regulator of RpoE activity)
VGLDPKYAFAPTQGRTVHSVAGDHIEQIGRLADTLYLGDKAVPHPLVEVIDDQSAIGGGILKYFIVTFDQAHDRVIFDRASTDPIALPALRSVGLCFDKTPAYWRVVSVIPKTPASAAGIEAGDLVTAIDGKPAAQWDTRAYDELMSNADQIDFTFLNGTTKTDHRLKVIELVP